jgi:hypothetical protein
MRHPAAAGQRFLLYGNQCRMAEFVQMLSDEFRPLGFRPTTLEAPRCIVSCLAFWGDKVSQTVKDDIGVIKYYDAKNVKNILNINVCTDNERMVNEMAHSAIANGVIPNKNKHKATVDEYRRPEIDLTGLPLASDTLFSPISKENV